MIKRNLLFLPIAFLPMILIGLISSANSQEINMDEIKKLYDSTLLVEADIFSPESYAQMDKYFTDLELAISKGKKYKKQSEIASKFREFAENSLKTTIVTKLALEEYLKPRSKAIAAKAPNLVPDLYDQAELQFVKATKKVEKGDSKGALKIVDKAMPLFDIAELEAIKTDILGTAAGLIAKAEADDAAKYAPATLDKSRVNYDKCVALLNNDRYERDKSLKLSATSEYEAGHAANIAQSVRSLERNDQAWEKLMLLYEIEMKKIGTEMGLTQLPFNNGPLQAAEAMVAKVKEMESEKNDYQDALKQVSQLLSVETEKNDVASMIVPINQAIDELISNKEELSNRLSENSDKLADLESTHKKVTGELQVRQEAEAKIDSARSILNPTEGLILLSPTDDIIIRLSGLSFASGSSEISNGHVDLLDKVKNILEMFRDNKLMVEGHTDDMGERVTNMHLSEKRAFAVMQYMRSTLNIPADKISAVGYGPDKPIGTNKTKEGRAKNRRIDIIIFQ